MSVTESVVRCLVALGLLAAPFLILILVAQWKERRGDWKRGRLARGAVGGALAFEAALDPSRRAAIEYILTEQDEVQEEDEEGQGLGRRTHALERWLSPDADNNPRGGFPNHSPVHQGEGRVDSGER